MSNAKVNDRILQGIAEHSGADKVIEEFLTELIYLEAERPDKWWWKDVYKGLVDKWAAVWEAGNED